MTIEDRLHAVCAEYSELAEQSTSVQEWAYYDIVRGIAHDFLLALSLQAQYRVFCETSIGPGLADSIRRVKQEIAEFRVAQLYYEEQHEKSRS